MPPGSTVNHSSTSSFAACCDALSCGSNSSGVSARQGGTDGEAGPEFSGEPDRSPDAATGSRAPAEPGVARAEPVSEREVITRLQIFLDQRSFGPGKIDGRWGEFVAKALQRYQRANGENPTGQIDPGLQEHLQRIFPIYTTYQLTDDDFKRVGNIPYKPAEEAKVKAMLYRSITEFIAERYHSGEILLPS